MSNKRVTEINCEHCGRAVAVAAKGRIPSACVGCRDMMLDFERLERSTAANCEGRTSAELAALRKLLCGKFFGWTNGAFNAAKTANHKRKVATVPASQNS